MRTSSDFTISQKWEMLAYIFFIFFFKCLHSQIRATHWISFLCRVSFSVYGVLLLFWFFALTVCSPESLMGRSAPRHQAERVPLTFSLRAWGWKRAKANVSKATRHPIVSFLKNSKKKKKKKDAKMLWMYDWKCHLQDCTFLTVLFTKGIQLHRRKKRDLLYCI